MKYYAVTDDPNELLHYGVKGMKWGEHLFGTDTRRSPGYKRALGKLRNSVKKASSAIKKSSAQASMNRQQRQQERYNRAVQKAQQRVNIVEGLNNMHKLNNYEKRVARDQKAELKREKIAAKMDNIAQKNELKYAKNQLKMDKYIQKARQGKLKYGQLSDDQVHQITDRLSMERNARMLGSAEKSWRQQKKEAFRKGKLSGIERGTAAAMEEVARAGAVYGINHFMNRRKLNAAAKQEGKEEHIKNRAKNKKSRREMRQEVRTEAYDTELREGEINRRHLTSRGAARSLNKIEGNRLEQERVRKLNARMNDELDMANNTKYQKMLEDKNERERVRKLNETMNNALDMDRNTDYQRLLKRQEEDRFLTDEAHNAVRTARQNRENEERAERQREITAELAYKYNIFPGGNSNGNGQKGNKNGGGTAGFKDAEAAKEYYRRKYISKETVQQEQARLKREEAEAKRIAARNAAKAIVRNDLDNEFIDNFSRKMQERSNQMKQDREAEENRKRRREQALRNRLTVSSASSSSHLKSQKDAINDMSRGNTRYGNVDQSIVDTMFYFDKDKKRRGSSLKG